MATLKVERTKMDKETADKLVQTGAGTPTGEWLRRYWWPVGVSEKLKNKPTFIRIMGEDLVLFRDTSGLPGLVDAYCPHRRANLCLGNTDEGGIRCRYHGWLIGRDGSVLDTPAEPDDTFKETVKTKAYPVKELAGLLFAYFGPEDEMPELPNYDFLNGEGVHLASYIGVTKTNWLQALENNMDPIHLSFTHAPTFTRLAEMPESWFVETDHGVAYIALRPTDEEGKLQVRVNNLVLPSWGCSGATGDWLQGARGVDNPPITCRINVPIDDEWCLQFRTMWLPPEFAHRADELRDQPEHVQWDTPWRTIPISPFQEWKDAAATGEPLELGYTIPPGPGNEDGSVVSSMPPMLDRENENPLPTGDAGLRFFRKIILDSIDDVAEGKRAKGVDSVKLNEHGSQDLTTGEFFVSEESADILRKDPSAELAVSLPRWADQTANLLQ